MQIIMDNGKYIIERLVSRKVGSIRKKKVGRKGVYIMERLVSRIGSKSDPGAFIPVGLGLITTALSFTFLL